MPERPLVSILVTNYNYGKYLGRAVESVLVQSYDHWELIICDDGSTDDSVAKLAPYLTRHSRIRLVQQTNQGAGAALNAAYAASSGEVVALLDADDLFLPGKLAWLVAALRDRPSAGFVTHALEVVDGDGAPAGQVEGLVTADGYIGDEVLAVGGIFRGPPSSGLGLRRQVAEVLFPIPVALRRYQDAAVLRVAPLITRTLSTTEILGQFRKHGVNISSAAKLTLNVLDTLDEAGQVIGAYAIGVMHARGMREIPAAWTYWASYEHLLLRQQRAIARKRFREAARVAGLVMATPTFRAFSWRERLRTSLVLATSVQLRSLIPERRRPLRSPSAAIDYGSRAVSPQPRVPWWTRGARRHGPPE